MCATERSVIRGSRGERVIYDRSNNTIHQLNSSMSLLWSYCDESRTIDDLIVVMQPETGNDDTRGLIIREVESGWRMPICWSLVPWIEVCSFDELRPVGARQFLWGCRLHCLRLPQWLRPPCKDQAKLRRCVVSWRCINAWGIVTFLEVNDQ